MPLNFHLAGHCTKGAGTDQSGSKSLSHVIHLRCRLGVHNWEDEKPTQWGQMNGFQQWSSLSAIILHVGLSENRLFQIFTELEILEVYHVGGSMFLTKNHWRLESSLLQVRHHLAKLDIGPRWKTIGSDDIGWKETIGFSDSNQVLVWKLETIKQQGNFALWK